MFEYCHGHCRHHQASGIRTSVDSFNLVWEMFWQQVEACAAVIMVSFTAFRSVFLSNKQRVDRNNVRPSMYRRFQLWLSSKKESRGEAQNVFLPPQANQAPPHVTLGTSFQSIRQKGLLDSQVQPVSQSAYSSHSQDLEGSQTLEPQDRGAHSSAVTGFGSCEPQFEKDPLSSNISQGTEQKSRRHWWRMGIISTFTLSQSKGPDSEV